jgi:hypothetical protein
MADSRRRRAAAIAAVAWGGLLSGCGLMPEHFMPGHFNIPHSVSFADRCADVMKAAFPDADIAIDKSESQGTGIDTIVARVEGTRADMPEGGPLAHDLAVECTFDHNILSGFRWTKGPLH